MDEWQDHALKMVARLQASGELTDPRIANAFNEVPRHIFAPRFFVMEDGTGWRAVDDSSPDFVATVYDSNSLITQLDGVPDSWTKAHRNGHYNGGWPSSSSSDPALMAEMLEWLALADRQRVLEIGTGTGYNAALLCHRLGDQNVTSIDVDPVLVGEARDRLDGLGFHPSLAVMDAMRKIPAGPFDRIETTVAVPFVPPAWLAAVKPHGMIMVNLASGLISDALFCLIVADDGTAHGLAAPGYVTFMPTREAHQPQGYELHAGVDPSKGVPVATPIAFSAVNDYDTGFPTLLSLVMPDLQRYLTNADDWNWLIATDGSWVHAAEPNTVTTGGPRQLWPTIVNLWQLWEAHGRPGRARLGLSVTSSGEHTLWVDHQGAPLIRLHRPGVS